MCVLINCKRTTPYGVKARLAHHSDIMCGYLRPARI